MSFHYLENSVDTHKHHGELLWKDWLLLVSTQDKYDLSAVLLYSFSY